VIPNFWSKYIFLYAMFNTNLKWVGSGKEVGKKWLTVWSRILWLEMTVSFTCLTYFYPLPSFSLPSYFHPISHPYHFPKGKGVKWLTNHFTFKESISDLFYFWEHWLSVYFLQSYEIPKLQNIWIEYVCKYMYIYVYLNI